MLNIILTFALFITGCSQGGGGSSAPPTQSPTTPWQSYAVSTLADLPTCAGDIIGRLYYVEAANNFQVCKTAGWTVIDVKGADGSNGITITTNETCSKIDGSFLYAYKVATFSTGDKWTGCSITGPSFESGVSFFFKSTQTGASIEYCQLGYDNDGTVNGGYWEFSKNTTTLVKTAVFANTGSIDNGKTVTFATSDCTSN